MIVPLTLSTDQVKNINGEINLNDKTKKWIVFLHGFGVTRDDRGLFTDIGNILKANYSLVYFDYCDLDSNGDLIVKTPGEQVFRLDSVMGYIIEKYQPETIQIIAHSQGCLITSLSKQLKRIKRLTMLTPPIEIYNPIKSMTRFKVRPGTVINLLGESKLRRADGSYTLVPREFIDEMSSLKPVEIYSRANKLTEVTIIRANQDEIINNLEWLNKKEFNQMAIDGDHNFTGNSRVKFLNLLATEI